MDFNQKEFNKFVLDNCKIMFLGEDKELASGRKTRLYFKWRLDDMFANDVLSDYIISFTRDLDLNPDGFYGVPEGMNGLAAITNLKWGRQSPNYGPGAHSFPMGRKYPKERNGKIENFVTNPLGKTVVLEDTVTVGTNIFPEIEKLKRLPCVSVSGVIVLTDRMQIRDDGLSVRQAMEKIGVPFYSMSNALELLPLAVERQNPDKGIIRLIEKEYEIYGVDKLKLR